jgi:hypothetical protein
MGFAITWVGIKGISLAKAALIFGLAQSGPPEDVMVSETSGAQVGEWAIVVIDLEPKFADESELLRLSTGRDIVVVHIEETTMMFWASRWRNGHEVWAVRHEAVEGPRHLEVEGDLPAQFPAIRDKFFAAQDKEDAGESAVDFIAEIPIGLAEDATGFRHDTMGPEYYELLPAAPQ